MPRVCNEVTTFGKRVTIAGAWGWIWYDERNVAEWGDITEAMTLTSWTRLLTPLCDEWNVFATDLMNEPTKASWGLDANGGTACFPGGGQPNFDWEHTDTPCKPRGGWDWGNAASRLGNHILSVCPRLLVMVEGVHKNTPYTGAPSGDGLLWGENLMPVRNYGVWLRDRSKLVYSPHS